MVSFLHFHFSPHFFKDIRISALALLKMVMHARSGGTLEVMGLLVGKVDGNTMVVMDSFALPVEGTETRVNAQAQAYEYMTQYMESAKKVIKITKLLLLVWKIKIYLYLSSFHNKDYFSRLDGWKMPLDGITVILGTAAGSVVLTSPHRC